MPSVINRNWQPVGGGQPTNLRGEFASVIFICLSTQCPFHISTYALLMKMPIDRSTKGEFELPNAAGNELFG
jgi:hypothetical protein